MPSNTPFHRTLDRREFRWTRSLEARMIARRLNTNLPMEFLAPSKLA